MSYNARIAECYQEVSLSREELAYYARHILLPGVGLDGQRKLKAARVLVVGAGGLGCPVLQGLAGAGVGQITVVDGDQVSKSNLSRQWLHDYAEVGRNKADSAAASIEKRNPFISVLAVAEMLAETNARTLIESCDLVVDATDDLEVRYLIDSVCAAQGRPWIHAALYRESSQMTVFWASCGATFQSLYPDPSNAPSCSGAGMLGASASLTGNLQALEAIKLITGTGRPTVGEVVSINSADLVMERFRMAGISQPKPITSEAASSSPWALSASELKQALSIHQSLTLVDLRKEGEALVQNSIRMTEEQVLEAGLPEQVSGRTVLVCEKGIISAMLADALSRYHEQLCFLDGGTLAFEALH
jgi:adenylyltransferase/sulfurtransferase